MHIHPEAYPHAARNFLGASWTTKKYCPPAEGYLVMKRWSDELLKSASSTHMEASSDRDSAVANVPIIATVVSISEQGPSQEVCKTNVCTHILETPDLRI
jgi:hypothetical protein